MDLSEFEGLCMKGGNCLPCIEVGLRLGVLAQKVMTANVGGHWHNHN
jgi:hypothetical protein